MNRFRVLMMTATLLASATAVNAQSVSVSALQAAREAEQAQTAPRSGYTRQTPLYHPPTPAYQELVDLETAAQRAFDNCPDGCRAGWHVQAMHHVASAWQRVRTMCTTSGETAKCCEAACPVLGQVKPGVCRDAAGCVVGGVGCAKSLNGPTPATRTITFSAGINSNSGVCTTIFELLTKQSPCCGVKEATCPLGFTVGKVAAPCCCAKACACCETCKAKPAVVQQLKPGQPMTWTAPAPAAVQAWTMPVPPPTGARVVVGLPTSGTTSKPAHLVTPDLEAHCQKITHRDGLIILEGNVMLLCKKNAQPIRIEAPRVVVNMRDGSFTVESTAMMQMPVGLLRTSGMEVPTQVHLPYGVQVPLCPPGGLRVIEVVPAPHTPR